VYNEKLHLGSDCVSQLPAKELMVSYLLYLTFQPMPRYMSCIKLILILQNINIGHKN